MKYSIGDIVQKNNKNDLYIILSTKENNLDSDYISKNKIKVCNIQKIAENNLRPISGFDYAIAKIINKENNFYTIDEITNVFEEDIYN